MNWGRSFESVSLEKVTLPSRKPFSPHTRSLWGAGLQGNALVRSLGLELERGNRIGVDGEPANSGSPRGCFAVGDNRRDHGCQDRAGATAARIGRACSPGEHVGETIGRLVEGKENEALQVQRQGTMATIGRGAAVVQMLGGRTMKGKAAAGRAWGTVHLALLLPTNEDRAKAVVAWAGAGG